MPHFVFAPTLPGGEVVSAKAVTIYADEVDCDLSDLVRVVVTKPRQRGMRGAE